MTATTYTMPPASSLFPVEDFKPSDMRLEVEHYHRLAQGELPCFEIDDALYYPPELTVDVRGTSMAQRPATRGKLVDQLNLLRDQLPNGKLFMTSRGIVGMKCRGDDGRGIRMWSHPALVVFNQQGVWTLDPSSFIWKDEKTKVYAKIIALSPGRP